MRSIEKRIAIVEAQCASKKWNPMHDAAFQRVRSALVEALVSSVSMKCNTHHRGSMFDSGPSFQDLVQSLHARMSVGAMTTEDHRVLAALPVEDLQQINITAESIVGLYAKLFADF
jgi:uncharacterized protein GlcG (DUF336 family)